MDYTKGVEVNFICQIPELNLSCWGCCGRNYTNQKQVDEQIDKNTIQFKKIKIPSTLRLLIFRDRFSEDCWDVTPCGICSNLVRFENGIYACPLHKEINNIVPKSEFLKISKKDLRADKCDVNCRCESVEIYNLISKEQKQEYIEWLSKQNFNHYEYSIGNVEGKIIKKFLAQRNQIVE